MKNKTLPKVQRVVDSVMSVAVFVVVNILVFLLAFNDHDIPVGVFISIFLVYCFSVILVLSYRVNEIADEIVFSKIIGKPSKVKIDEIKEITSIVKMLYVVKLQNGKLLVVFNHLGFGSLLFEFVNNKSKD